jgi:hypothetical protein
MNELKSLLGIIAILLTFSGYIPYVRDIINGKTKPHMFSWFLWGFVTMIVFALQYVGNAGVGAFVTLSAALMCYVVIALSFKYKSTSDITKTDILFIVAAFIARSLYSTCAVVNCQTTSSFRDFSYSCRLFWLYSNNSKILE